jgi:folate-binding protein YgfZ
VTKVAAERAIYAALLTPQGKFLHDFFIAAIGETLYLDCESARRGDLQRRLSIYKLRAKVALRDASNDWAVALLFGGDALQAIGLGNEPGHGKPWQDGVAFADPRLTVLGARAILPRQQAAEILGREGFLPGRAEDYERLRISNGVPDGSRDLPVEKAILLENGFDELHGIDWQKGCYMGQELTARTRYRGLIRKRLLPVEIDGAAPAPGTPIMRGDAEVGETRSAIEGWGLALLRLDALESVAGNAPLLAGGSRLKPHKPGWVEF